MAPSKLVAYLGPVPDLAGTENMAYSPARRSRPGFPPCREGERIRMPARRDIRLRFPSTGHRS